MKSYHPDAELAPRDVVSRAIISEMVRTSSKHVYLDLTHLNAEFIKKRFPRIYSTCLQYDVNITKDLIPVSPAAHYVMGGLRTDLNGATNIEGLFAAGEVACTGVHGANRLASNSLLEGLVFGAIAGRTALNCGLQIKDSKLRKLNPLSPSFAKAGHEGIVSMEEIRLDLRKLMWERVGIIRCEESLGKAEEKLAEWSFILNKSCVTRRELEIKNMLTVAELITRAAILRKGSVGAHYRSDFPERGKDWKKHIAWKKEDERLSYRFVN